MTKRHFSNWIKAYQSYASYSEAPKKFHFWTAVSTIASVLQRKVWIDQRYFQWVPNFYIVLVAPPGIMAKTTTLDIGQSMLKEVSGVHFGPDVVTWQALVTSLAEAKIDKLIPDTSPPLYEPMCCISFMAGEFGNLLDPSDREMVDLLITLWDSRKGAFRKQTKTQGADVIENPCINILACTNPSWIKDAFPRHFITGGLSSRCVFIHAEEKEKLVAYPGYAVPNSKALDEMHARLVEDLQTMNNMYGEYMLTPEAIQWGEQWYREHWTRDDPAILDPRFGGWRARKQTHIHKIAIVLASSKRSELVITKRDLIEAEQVVTSLEPEMFKVLDNVGMSDAGKEVRTIIEIVSSAKIIARTELYRQVHTVIGPRQFMEALNGALQTEMIKARSEGGDLILEYSPPRGLKTTDVEDSDKDVFQLSDDSTDPEFNQEEPEKGNVFPLPAKDI